jgi:collagenase-like PrtC family protease
MRLSVPANFDCELVPQLARFPVEEVYGKLPSDFFGGGRPSYMTGPVGLPELGQYVALLDRHGIAFNYLLNASCMGNREWTRGAQRRLARLLDRLGEMGVRRLTVSTPFLLQAIKARFPHFRVKVGMFAHVDTPRRAREWVELGADAIQLESVSVNRNLRPEGLQAIRKAVDCDLQLIPNLICLPNCAAKPYHQNGFAHASDGSGTVFIDFCFLRCVRKRLEDPSLFVKAPWIRPEDLPVYEELGYHSFKIVERNMPSAVLLQRVRAYAGGRFGGNLADILLPYGFKQPIRKPRFWALRHFFKPRQVSPARLKPLYELMRDHGMLFPTDRSPIRIHAEKIPADFIQGFRSRDCSRLDCAACRLCERVAEHAVEVDPDFREEFLRRFQEAEEDLITGRLWGA